MGSRRDVDLGFRVGRVVKKSTIASASIQSIPWQVHLSKPEALHLEEQNKGRLEYVKRFNWLYPIRNQKGVRLSILTNGVLIVAFLRKLEQVCLNEPDIM